MPDDEVKEMLAKYQKQEAHLNELLQQNATNLKCALENLDEPEKRFISLEEAVQRNKLILKDLETVKGSLRSKAIYSPSEMQWDAIYKQYQACPSLPVTSWKCHTSVYV